MLSPPSTDPDTAPPLTLTCCLLQEKQQLKGDLEVEISKVTEERLLREEMERNKLELEESLRLEKQAKEDEEIARNLAAL